MVDKDAMLELVLLSDNAFKRKLAKLALQALGADVREAGSAATALEALAQPDFAFGCAAVIVAMRDLPGDGCAAARQLREAIDAATGAENAPRPALAIISATPEAAALDQAAGAGSDYTLIEPVDWNAFVTRLSEERAAAQARAEEQTRPEQEAAAAPPPFELTDRLNRGRQAAAEETAPPQEPTGEALAPKREQDTSKPNRFVWRPLDDAFACGAAAAHALGWDAEATPTRLPDWLSGCVSPRPEIVRAALEAALSETGETLLVGSAQSENGEQRKFGLFAERRRDAQGRDVITGAAHLAAAWSADVAKDAVTGLLTPDGLRAELTDALRRAVEERRKCALYALEIPDFYEVDETFGVDAGDMVLAEAAERLRHVVRAGDVVARTGRARFAVVQPEVKSLDDVRGLGARLSGALSEPFEIAGVATRLQAAIGAAVGPDHARTASAFAAAAETALKEATRRRVVGAHLYGRLAEDPAKARSTWRREAQSALMSGEFELHYQPGVSAAGEPVCVEALLRLRRGESWVAPHEVVDIAEQSGDVLKFVRRFLEIAAADWTIWRRAAGGGARLSLNVTGAALAEGRLFEQAAAILGAAGAGPEHLRFETTDRALERRRAQAVSSLAAAQAAGVEIALDDFGGRASPLTALRGFAFDRVKITQSLLEDGAAGGPDLFCAAAQLAQALKLRAGATGVSDQALKTRAFQLGCDEVQGFVVAPPARMTDLVGWFGAARTAV